MQENVERKFCSNRNNWLISSDKDFIKYCSIENYQSSGKGGQKRNRKYSAVRLTHIETGISVTCSEYREQNLNRTEAIRKLKFMLALSLSGNTIENIRSITSLKSQNYPLWVAFVLDVLYINSFDIEHLANQLSLSKTNLLKLLYRDRKLWKEINIHRAKLGKYQLVMSS